MKIKKYYIGNNVNIIDQFIKELIKNNISYVLITDKEYVEIHFLENIYRFYSNPEINITNISITFENIDPLSILFKELAFNNLTKKFCDSEKVDFKYKKERPGFKKYTKKDIRRDSKSNKINPKVKKKLSMYY